MIYLVIQEGVYRHDVRGVYSTLEKATDAAEKAAAEDDDSYHEYVVCETELDTYVEDVDEVDGLRFQQKVKP